MLTSLFALIIGLAGFGSIDGQALPTYSHAPMTWEDAPEAMIEAGHILPGDDNADGYIDEDESGWDCATMGNQICGPGSDISIDESCQSWDHTPSGTFFTYGQRNLGLPLCPSSVN